MLFLATYRVRPFLGKADQKDLMDLFAKHGTAPGTVAHYVSATGSKGWTVLEAGGIDDVYATVLKYTEYLEFEIEPILPMDEALPHLIDALQ